MSVTTFGDEITVQKICGASNHQEMMGRDLNRDFRVAPASGWTSTS